MQLPSESVRISGPQLALVLADLKPFVCGSLTLQRRFVSLADLPGFSAERRARQVELEAEGQQPHLALLAFWQRLNHIGQRTGQAKYRLSLDLFEARVCSAALRLAMRRCAPRPASAIPNSAEMSRRRSQLLKKVENLVRRLKRQLKAQAGEAVSANFSRVFDDFRGSILNVLFHRQPACLKPVSLRRFHQIVIDKAVKLAREGLLELGTDADLAQLRPLVRRLLRYNRRDRPYYYFSIPELSNDMAAAKKRLVNFIQGCWKKQNSRPRKVTKIGRTTNGKT